MWQKGSVRGAIFSADEGSCACTNRTHKRTHGHLCQWRNRRAHDGAHMRDLARARDEHAHADTDITISGSSANYVRVYSSAYARS